MIDFSKLMDKIPKTADEHAELNRQYYVWSQQQEMDEAASQAVARSDFIVTEDPNMRFDRTGLPYAILYAEKDGKPVRAEMRGLINESSNDFADRVESLSRGDKVIVDGHPETRRWKDSNNKWRSQEEFIIGSFIEPQGMNPKLLDGVVRTPTKFVEQNPEAARPVDPQIKSQTAAQAMASSQGISR